MFIDNLKQTYSTHKGVNRVFLRNILKESIQFYILDYVYKSAWGKSFIFKGGTCLRFCFGLPRLSEDLDFDVQNYGQFSIHKFHEKIGDYFTKTLQYRQLSTKIANNMRTIYLKFPILSNIGVPIGKSESDIVTIRIDLAPEAGTTYKTEIAIKSTNDVSFLMQRYTLEDLFAGKIAAILKRETIEGTIKKERFKGRDFFDLIWFLEKKIIPHWIYLEEITQFNQKEVIEKLNIKAKKVTYSDLKNDLFPFFENSKFVDQFAKNFKTLFESYKKILTT